MSCKGEFPHLSMTVRERFGLFRRSRTVEVCVCCFKHEYEWDLEDLTLPSWWESLGPMYCHLSLTNFVKSL